MDAKDLDSLSREALYDLVWSEAMATLAPKYGISDVALKKRCARVGVPTPPRGYWAKLEAGKSVRKAPLPKSYTVATAKKKRLPQSKDEVRKLPVPDGDYALRRPLPIVAYTRDVLKSHNADYNGLLQSLHGGALHTSVSPELLRRALWLWNELLKRLEKDGVTVDREGKLSDGKHAVPMTLKEKLSKYEVPRAPSKSEFRLRPHLPLHPLDVPQETRKFDSHFTPNGILCFKTDEIYGSGLRHEWKEAPMTRLEERLDEIAETVLEILKRKEVARLDRIERDKVRQEQERLASLEAQRRRHEKGRRKRLRRAAEAYGSAEELRTLANVLQGKADAEQVPGLTEFVQWIRERAEQRDPVSGILEALRAGRDPVEPEHEDLYDPPPQRHW